MYVVEVLGDAPWTTHRRLGPRPLIVGRDPDCDVVLAHPGISRRHAALRVHGDVVLVEDLRSRNGTFVADRRVTGEAVVPVGAVVRLGSHDALRVRAGSVVDVTTPRALALEDVASGHRLVLGTSPVTVGSSRDCVLRLPHGPDIHAVVLRQGEDEAWLGVGDDMVQLEPDVPFELLGRTLVLRVLDPAPAQTAFDDPTPWPYVARARRDAPGGPLAAVEDVTQGVRAELSATNTAVLLYLLVRAWARDAAAGVHVEERGWVDDDEVAVGVWGRDGPLRQLKVLVCRLRADLRAAGLDPWFVEKRRGALRVRVRDAVVLDEA